MQDLRLAIRARSPDARRHESDRPCRHDDDPGRSLSAEIVGVVADSVYFSLRESVPPTVYTPLAQFYLWPSNLASVSLNIRAAIASPQSLTKSVSGAINSVSPALSFTFQPLAGRLDASLVQERITAMLAGFFGALGLFLAAIGLHGVTSYAVARRRAEIAIRAALGATPQQVVRLMLSRVAVVVALGIAIGGAVSVWAGRFVASLLYGVPARDASTLMEG
jgi:putative ABC transport system permease protein